MENPTAPRGNATATRYATTCIKQTTVITGLLSTRENIVTYQSQVRKQKNTNIAVSILCIYFHLFTYIQCINDIHYAASCFSTKYLLPLLSLLIDPKYAVVPSCLFLSLIRVCDDNLQSLNDVVVHSVSCTCR